MRKIIYLICAIFLVGLILVTVVADVNHGHGPGAHTEEHEEEHGNVQGGTIYAGTSVYFLADL